MIEFRNLLVVRHGRTEWNATGRFQGQADPSLDAIGVEQAEQIATELCWLDPVAIVTSDLQRARHSAAPLARHCGIALAVDRDLREVDLGGWEGLNRTEAAARFPDEYRQWTAGAPVRRGGGETEAEAGLRVAGALVRRLGATRPGSTVVAVGHGLALRAALAALAERDVIRLDGPAPHLSNGRWLACAANLSLARDCTTVGSRGPAAGGRAQDPHGEVDGRGSTRRVSRCGSPT